MMKLKIKIVELMKKKLKWSNASMDKPIKRDANKIYKSLSASLPMSMIYIEFDKFIAFIIEKIDAFNYTYDLRNDVNNFLTLSIKKDECNNQFIDGKTENIGYTILLSCMGISREKMKNVVFPFHKNFKSLGDKPTINKILKDSICKEHLVDLLLNGFNDSELASILNGDIMTLRRFNLSRLSNLKDLFLDKQYIYRELEDTYTSRMQNKKGYSTETNILANIVNKLKLTYEAGEVPCLEPYFNRMSTDGDTVSRNPRIDLVIPNLQNPKIMIESTYNLTTASGQTKKVDANDSLYRAIKAYGKDKEKEVIFINFVDGGGWKSRGLADVSRLVSSCDYAINYNNLDLLEEILKYYFNIA